MDKIDEVMKQILADKGEVIINSPKAKLRKFETVIGFMPEDMQELWSYKLALEKELNDKIEFLNKMHIAINEKDYLQVANLKSKTGILHHYLWNKVIELFITQTTDFNLGLRNGYAIVTYSNKDEEKYQSAQQAKQMRRIIEAVEGVVNNDEGDNDD